jgi:hypothetical protein
MNIGHSIRRPGLLLAVLTMVGLNTYAVAQPSSAETADKKYEPPGALPNRIEAIRRQEQKNPTTFGDLDFNV